MSTQADDADFEVGRVSDLDDELTAELFRSSFQPSPRTAGVTRRWRDMSPEQAEVVWQRLFEWVRWLVATYQLTASVVPDCWWRHSELVAELYALQRAEMASFTSDDSGFGPLAFHERLPHAVERLRTHTRTAGCVGLQSHKEPVARVVPAEPAFDEWKLSAHQFGA
ncbi:conserved hypothetical protein [Arthrobacter sp. 9V]|uniref:hypothetical protein n=1 Tax=Arthrobacter sp. 9V TaxID=2653132 RepID=UPI0012EF6072|nr:hypothetical protein [Arthrobacter sp. 9V]VXB56410.1 conserved hypothetical protein [Arthrobacter sp. 9V]